MNSTLIIEVTDHKKSNLILSTNANFNKHIDTMINKAAEELKDAMKKLLLSAPVSVVNKSNPR